jgi:protoporphyrinogen oxidase
VTEIVILGAGLTGLSTAYHLEQQGFSDFSIFEKNAQPGGLLKSFQQENFTFDFTGHFLHINNDYFRNFLNKICGLQNFDLVTRNSAIYFDRKFTSYPFQMNLHQLPTNIALDSIYGFINRKTNIKKPKNFYEWVLKYFGIGMGKHFFYPYNSKLLSYDVKKITPSWTGRFVPQTTIQDILKVILQKTDKTNVGYNNQFYYPKKDGIQFLINNLVKNLNSKIHLNHNAVSIDLKTKTVFFENGHQEKFNKLITTLPLNIFLKKINEKNNTALKNASKKLICNSVINFNLGFDVTPLTNKHWSYFPEKKYSFYRIGYWHNISPSSTPKNYSAIYGETSYLPGTKTKKQTSNLLDNSINQALKIFKLNKTNIVTQKILPIPHAYVVYNFWREKNLNKLHRKLNNLSIYSIGRYGEWKYSSMQEAVLDGKKTAEQILEKLIKIKIKSSCQTIIPAIKYKQIQKKREKEKKKILEKSL